MGGVHRVLVGITGGIAAYKVPLLVRLLRKNGCEVKVALTNAAKTLVGVDALRTLSGSPVYLDAGNGGGGEYDMGHIRLSEWADVFLVCPATANTIAKIACGIADNLLSTLALSIPEERIIVAPAMNSVMWANAATRANIDTLSARGITVLPVEDGELACGVCGPGRMLGIEEIGRRVLERFGGGNVLLSGDTLSGDKSLKDNELGGDGGTLGGETPPVPQKGGNLLGDNGLAVKDTSYRGYKTPPVLKKGYNFLRDNGLYPLKGRTVLISSGPTEEPLDPVRVITNRSSGKMGAALAKAALTTGARVIVVSGPASEPLPAGAEAVYVRTAAEMEREMSARFGAADVCVMAAAVSDYRPVDYSDTKMRRSDKASVTLELTPNPDILAGLGALKSKKQFLVGFALESGSGVYGVNRATKKMKAKRCDMMVLNRVDAALGKESTAFTILYPNGSGDSFSMMGKDEAARVIFNKINELARW